jgi:hypothetical protein
MILGKKIISILIFFSMLLGMTESFAYSDIQTSPYKEDIEKLVELGVIYSSEQAKFRPQDYITREEYVSLLMRAVNKTSNVYKGYFNDVSENVYAYDIDGAYELGVIPAEMIVDNNFYPKQNITREEAAAIAFETFGKVHGYKVPEVSCEEYKDRDEMSIWAVTCIESCIEFGFIEPKLENSFAPKEGLTRGEAARTAVKILDGIENIDRNTLIWDDIDVAAPVKNGKIKWATEFGMSPESEDNYEAITEAIKYCKENNVYKLIVPKGIYKFTSTEKIILQDMEDFILDCQGSEFIFSGDLPQRAKKQAHYLQLSNCKRVEVRDVTLDWDWDSGRLSSLAVIKRVDDLTLDMEFPEVEYMKESDLIFHCLDLYDLEGGTWGSAVPGETITAYAQSFTVNERLNDNTFRVTCNNTSYRGQFKEGQAYLIRHYEYEFHGFVVYGGEDLTFDGINVYSAAGHAYTFGDGATRWQMLNCTAKIRPGAKRYISSNTDGLHCGSMSGEYKLENCEISQMGDDCSNIYRCLTNEYTRNTEKKNAIDINFPTWRFPLKVGEVIEFRYPDMYSTGVTATVTRVDDYGDSYYVEFDKDLPDIITDNMILKNLNYSAEHYVIRNCKFISNKVRGSLIHEGFGLIEGNIWDDNGRSNLLITNGIGRWAEGFDMDNVIFRNNVFKNANQSALTSDGGAAVVFSIELPNGGVTDYPVYRNMAFLNNQFINYWPSGLHINAAKNIKVRNNTFSVDSSEIPVSAYRESIYVTNAKDVYISGNKWLRTDFFTDDSAVEINVDDKSVSNCVVQYNTFEG